ncbi:MAG: winged helix-turn-helix transcriptional regulator [Clostridia bacterium]|nr:winged helix-turn-helix transcriptional regulator [Clostridia bacterium]
MIEKFRTFTYLIASLNRLIKKIKTEEMLEYNLKSPHVSCLYYVYKVGSITAKELSDLCGEDKATISRSLNYLGNHGYIVDGQELKRYKTPIILTEKGAETAKLISRKIDGFISMADDGIAERDVETMYRSLKIVNDNLSKICENYNQ